MDIKQSQSYGLGGIIMWLCRVSPFFEGFRIARGSWCFRVRPSKHMARFPAEFGKCCDIIHVTLSITRLSGLLNCLLARTIWTKNPRSTTRREHDEMRNSAMAWMAEECVWTSLFFRCKYIKDYAKKKPFENIIWVKPGSSEINLEIVF